MNNNKKEINTGSGCLTDVIAILLFIIICDVLGCEWCHGFSKKLHDTFTSSERTEQIHPSDCR